MLLPVADLVPIWVVLVYLVALGVVGCALYMFGFSPLMLPWWVFVPVLIAAVVFAIVWHWWWLIGIAILAFVAYLL